MALRALLGPIWELFGASWEPLGGLLGATWIRFAFYVTFISLFESILGLTIDGKKNNVLIRNKDDFVIEFRPSDVQKQVIFKHDFQTHFQCFFDNDFYFVPSI